MEAKIQILIYMNVFKIVKQTADMKVLSGVWALKIKWYPDSCVNKLKACCCACGFEQTIGIGYFETFSQVVMWLIVRLLLVVSILFD